MTEYLEQKLLPANPFETLDVEGVGQLVRMGCEQGPRDASRPQARHLRRARRRSRVGRVLPRGRPRLRVVLAVPRADRPPRRRARRARHAAVPAHRPDVWQSEAGDDVARRGGDHRVPRRRVPGRDGALRDRRGAADVARGSACCSSECRLRPGGTISGPSLMTLADTGLWVALLAMIGREPLSVTSHLDIDFLRKPAPADVIARHDAAQGRQAARGRRRAHVFRW